jgi:hypothetical protein
MPVPWNQIVQLMPSIIEVSRELLRRTKEPASGAGGAGGPGHSLITRSPTAELEERVRLLEDNEQRQAVLSTRMADQLAQLTAAVTALHRQVRWLLIAMAATAVLSLTALVVALR